MKLPKFTLGIEEEYQMINPVTRDLNPKIGVILDKGKMVMHEQIKAEMHQAMVEVGTNICQDITDAREQMTFLRKGVIQTAESNGFQVAAGGTHPFAKWQDQLIFDDQRYKDVVDEMQDAARSNLIFGLHVHVGMESRALGVYMMNAVRYFLPHIFALSTSSPFWAGRNTGFKSFRSKIFSKFPRTGIPEYFESESAYFDFINTLVKTGCIDNGKKIWWDIRVHPFFDTIEFRVCDVPMRMDETLAIAALIQALVAKLYKLKQNNLNFRSYRRSLIEENKWRAGRYGIDGKLIDFGKQQEVPTKDLILEFLNFVDNVVDELGSRKEIEYIQTMLEQGTSADRQLKVYEETGDLTKVVDYMVNEMKVNVI